MAETEQEINPNSLSYLIGSINTRLAAGDKIMSSLTTEINRLSNAITCLPCSAHDERLKVVEDDKSRRRGFWNDFKLVVISCVLTAVLSVGATLLIMH